MEYLAWPAAALVFGIIFLLFFKKPIESFIYRIRSLNKTGVSADTLQEIQYSAQDKQKVVQDLMGITDSVVVKEIETGILADLSSKGLNTSDETVHILSRHLAFTQLALQFEQVYDTIFGSQIILLKKLNEHKGIGRDRKFIDDYFSTVKSLWSQFKDWDTDTYLSFLIRSNLITLVSGNYHITNKGVDFLTWLIKFGRDENKIL